MIQQITQGFDRVLDGNVHSVYFSETFKNIVEELPFRYRA